MANMNIGIAGKNTQFKPGVSGNPAGQPKGYKRLSTWIKELANDENFECNILDSKKGLIEYKGAPIKAIISVAIAKAANGDDKAREWLGKYYGDTQQIEHSGEIGMYAVQEMSDNEINERLSVIARVKSGSKAITSGSGQAQS